MAHKFISENPVTDNLRFGHSEITETLSAIIETCGERFTIGLFGKWGSGKSSIALNLQRKLIPKEIPVIIFDVWKHEGNSLKRTFLAEIVRALQHSPYGESYFPKSFNLSGRLNSNTHTKRTQSIDLDFRAFFPFLWKGALLVIVFYLILFAVNSLFGLFEVNMHTVKESAVYVIEATVLTSIGLAILSGLKELMQKTELTVIENRFEDAHEFESEFLSVLKELKPNKIVVVFDNLDRLQGASMLEVLTAIKTFLDPKTSLNKKVVFVVPCDVEAIKAQLANRTPIENQHNRENYTDEFLKKIFNSILWIPDFYAIELESFAISKLKETGIKEFDDQLLAWLIIQVFRQNPRQVIQFVNILISNYLLFKHASVQGSFGDPNFYKTNIPQLAKYLLLIQRFPLEMSEYRRTRTYDFNIELFPVGDTGPSSEFIQFRVDTNDIHIKSLEPFFNFRISEQERLVPGISGLIQLLDENQLDASIEYYDKSRIGENREAFCKVIENALYSRQNSVSTNVFINGVLNLTKRFNLTLLPETYRTIHKRLLHSALPYIDTILPSALEQQFFGKLPPTYVPPASTKIKIVERWIEIVEEHVKGNASRLDSEKEADIIVTIMTNSTIVGAQFLDRFRASLSTSDRLAKNLLVCRGVFEHPLGHSLLTPAFLERIVNSMNFNGAEDTVYFQEIMDLFEKDSHATWRSISPALVAKKLADFLNIENRLNPLKPESKPRFEALLRFGKLFADIIFEASADDQRNISNELRISFDRSKWETSYFVLPLVVSLSFPKHPSNPLHEMARHVKREFFSYGTNLRLEDIEYVLINIDAPAEVLSDPSYSPQLEQLAQSNKPFFMFLFKRAGITQKVSLVMALIGRSQHAWVEEVVETTSDLSYLGEVKKALEDRRDSIAEPELKKRIERLIEFVVGVLGR